jgi:hypothetical protein
MIPATPATGPTNELGAVRDATGLRSLGRGGWSWQSFIDDVEKVPDLAWPNSVHVSHLMRSDSQVDALYLGTTLPIRGMLWSIDPNGANTAAVERACKDTGLPVKGRENEPVPRSAFRFNFDQHLTDALLALIYAHYYFEIVGFIGDDEWWHLRKLAPRHPRTIADFDVDLDGGLRAIRQNVMGQASGPLGVGTIGGAIIPVDRLVGYIWQREGGSVIGRSMLRSMYREWLVKDRLIRVDAINHERAGGVPVAEAPEGATDGEISRLASLARQFRVTEGGGGAIPHGSKMHLVSAGGSKVIESIRYCDESMARVWMMMLIQLGQTQTGSRALGGSFENVAATFRDAIAGWLRRHFDEYVLNRQVEWNEGDTAEFSPRLHCEPRGNSDALAAQDLATLIDSGALVVDGNVRAWVRGRFDLPEVDPSEPAALSQAAAPIVSASGGAPPEHPRLGSPAARRRPARQVVAALSLPDRPLRRQPYDVEVRAAVDFRSLDQAHDLASTSLEGLYLERVIPAQIAEVVAQITTTQKGEPRKVATRVAMARLSASAFNVDEVHEHLIAAARAGAGAAVRECAAQGMPLAGPDDEALAALVADHVKAVTTMTANDLSLAAQRRATQLVGGRSPQTIATETASDLSGLKHQWTVDQLRGAVTMAQNSARAAVFSEALKLAPADVYASELLDSNTCSPCIANDGKSYGSLDAAIMDYASGGFVQCEGGPRCRGTLVLVRAEQDPSPGAGALPGAQWPPLAP